MTSCQRTLCLMLTTVLSLLPFLSAPAQAEIVRVLSADGGFGQGWMHVSRSGSCRVALPAHVVPASGEGIASDVAGRQYELTAPHRPDQDIDLAFMTVAVARGTICTPSRLGPSQLEQRIANLGSALLVHIDVGERRTMAVELVAASVDDRSGRILAFRPRNPDDHFRQGMSGGTIIAEDGTMIAMLTEVDPESGTGIALRFDAIRRLSETAPEPAGPRPALTIMIEAGAAVDPALPPSRLLNGEIWRAAPRDGRLSLLISAEESAIFTGLSMKASCGTGSLARVALSVRNAADHPFATEIPCDIGAGSVTCRTAPRRMRQMRLLFTSSADQVLCLEGLLLTGLQ